MSLFKRKQSETDPETMRIARLIEGANLLRVETAKRLLEEVSKYYEPEPDEAGWTLIAQAGKTIAERGLDQTTLDGLRTLSRKLALQNSHMKALLRNYQKYILGHGITISAAKDDPQREAKDKAWRMFQSVNHWDRRQKEIVLRAFRDGECFLRCFGDGQDTKVRFLEPEWVQDPQGRVLFGIETQTDPPDNETVVTYCYNPTGIGADNVEKIEAGDVIHIKLGVDSACLRGIPYLYSEFQKCNDYDTWLHYLLVYLKVATAIVLLRKHAGMGPTQLAAYADKLKTSDKVNSTGTSTRQWKVNPGTVVDILEGEEWNYLTPKLDAGPLTNGGRAILLAIAAGAGQTEPMVSADASNANYASTMVAEAPAIREYEDWQDFFSEYFVQVWRRVTGTSADEDYEPNVTLPRIVSRNRLEEAKADEVLAVQGVMSVQTWREREGLDPDTEKENLQNEMAEALGPKRKSVTGENEPPPQYQEET